MCMAIMAIEIYGIFAVVSRRVQAVRLFFFLSVLVTLLVLAIYIIQAVVHSKFKNDIIQICTNVNRGDHIFFTGFFGPVDGGVVTPAQAQEWCNQEFNHYTVSNIVALLVVTAIAAIFAFFVYAYLHQLKNQASPATFPLEAYQNNQTYNAYNPTPAYKPTYNPYNTQAYNPTHNNELSNETLHVPEDAFDHDKPPTYVGEGLVDRKEKDYDSQWSSEGRSNQGRKIFWVQSPGAFQVFDALLLTFSYPW